jgi:hypothetical protein
MSWDNARAMKIYRQVKSGVMQLPEHLENCPLLAENIYLIDDTLGELKQERLAESVAMQLARFIAPR